MSKMKSLLVGIATLAFFFPGASAEARPKKGNQTDAPVVTTRSSAQSRSEWRNTGNGFRIGVGFSTFGSTTVNGNSVGFVGGSPTAISTWMDFNDMHSLQAFFAIGGTNPFQFGTGAAYRLTPFGGQQAGFHFGGLFNLGIIAIGGNQLFYVSMAPIGGFHFSIPQLDMIGLSVEGGPQFTIVDGNFNFALASISPTLGLSVHYFF